MLKKQDLQHDLEKYLSTLEQRRPDLDQEQEKAISQTISGIDITLILLAQTESTPFELANLPEHLALLQGFQKKLGDMEPSIRRCQEWDKKTSTKLNLDDKLQLFKRERERYALSLQFWEEFYRFTSYYKEVGRA